MPSENCNKVELLQKLKKSVVVPISTKGDKTDFSKYWGMLLLSNRHKILLNILLSRLTSQAEEIIGDN